MIIPTTCSIRPHIRGVFLFDEYGLIQLIKLKNDVKDSIHRGVVIQSNRFILLVTSILLLSLLEAQHGQYDRKSISTLGMIWDHGE